MTGIPKSRGCQNCKRRKIKCDESWPTCVQCMKTGSKCPGPTPLVKFIHNCSHLTIKCCRKSACAGVESGASQSDNFDSSLRLHKVYYPNVKDATAGYGLLKVGLARGNPTTLADRVGTRLVTSMERGPQGITNIYMSYLPELPKRLANSPCLRDSVDLFCSAWSGFRRRHPQGELMGMSQYGKALRSLQQALLGKRAGDIETLTAITLLERTSRLFDRCQNVEVHLKGIRQTFMKRGLPKMHDPLDVAVTNEIHALLLDNRPMNEENEFTKISPWKEAFDQCAEEQSRIIDVSPFLRDDILTIYELFKQLALLSADFREISHNPFNDEMVSLSLSIRKRLQEMKESSRRIAVGSWKRGLEEHAIRAVADRGAMKGQKFDFKSIKLFGLYQRMLLCQLVPLRILYEISSLYGSPDETILSEFRNVGKDAWSMIPYLRSLECIVAVDFLGPTCVSYEAAEDWEKKYILDSVQQIDEGVGRFPRDREELNDVLIEKGKLTTGLKCSV